MKKLVDCVDVRYEDGTFLLIPRQADEIDLIMLGFDGTEKWIRLECLDYNPKWTSRCYVYTATICKQNGKSWSWQWGYGGYTLVSDSVRETQHKIVEACQMYCKRNGICFPGKGW